MASGFRFCAQGSRYASGRESARRRRGASDEWFARLADPYPCRCHAPCVARRPRSRHNCPGSTRDRPRHPESGRPQRPLRGHRRLPRRGRPADGCALHAPPHGLPARPAADRIGAAGLHLGEDLRHLGPGRAAHAGAPSPAARHSWPHAGHQGADVAGDELGLHRDLAHELLLQYRRGRGHLLRLLRRAAARDAAPGLQRCRNPPRGAQFRRHQERRRQLAPGRKGHGLQRDGGLDGQRRLAGLAGAEPRGLRRAPHPVLQPGRRARRHPDDDAGGHPPLSCRQPSPRQHGHGGRVPEVRRTRRPAGALRSRADEGCAERPPAPGRFARQAAQARRRPRRRPAHLRVPAHQRAAAQPGGSGVAGQPRARRRRATACRALLRQPRGRCQHQSLWPAHRQPQPSPGHRRTLGQCRGRGVGRPSGGDRHRRRAPGRDDRRRAARDPQRRGRRDPAHRGVRRWLGRTEGVQRADRQPRRRTRAAGAQVPRHAAGLRLAQRQLGLGEPAAATRALPRGAQVAGAQARIRQAADPARLEPQCLARGPRALEDHRRRALCHRCAAQRRAHRPRAGRTRGAPCRGDRAAEAPLRHERCAAGAGAPCRRCRCRAGAHRQGHPGAAHALRQVAADDARRRPAVRIGPPGQWRAAGGLALRQHDRRDDGPGAAPGRRAAGRVALPVLAARPAHPRRRDRQRPARPLRADERTPAPRDSFAHRHVRHQCPHRPGGAGAARLGRGAGGIPPCARLDGAGAVCARLAHREPAAPARPGRPAARSLAQHGAERGGELGQRPRQCLADATPAGLAGVRLLPHPHAQRPAPALAAAGPGTRRRRGARGLPYATRGKRPHARPHAPEGTARRRQGAGLGGALAQRNARSPARRCATST